MTQHTSYLQDNEQGFTQHRVDESEVAAIEVVDCLDLPHLIDLEDQQQEREKQHVRAHKYLPRGIDVTDVLYEMKGVTGSQRLEGYRGIVEEVFSPIPNTAVTAISKHKQIVITLSAI